LVPTMYVSSPPSARNIEAIARMSHISFLFRLPLPAVHLRFPPCPISDVSNLGAPRMAVWHAGRSGRNERLAGSACTFHRPKPVDTRDEGRRCRQQYCKFRLPISVLCLWRFFILLQTFSGNLCSTPPVQSRHP